MGRGRFSTATRGASEREWRLLLEGSRHLRAVAQPLMVVAPHPDDETLATGGLLYRYPHSLVLLVTDGEAAQPTPTLRQTRRTEMRAALRVLGHARVQRLGIPDSGVALCEDSLERALESRVQAFATLVAPFEDDGHTDHDSVGRVCLSVAKRHRKPLLRYMVWKWHLARAADFHPRQFVRLSLNASAQAAKRRAIALYQSQIRGERNAVVPPHVLEYFHRPFEAFLR